MDRSRERELVHKLRSRLGQVARAQLGSLDRDHDLQRNRVRPPVRKHRTNRLELHRCFVVTNASAVTARRIAASPSPIRTQSRKLLPRRLVLGRLRSQLLQQLDRLLHPPCIPRLDRAREE
jgi:hypothetical protein